MQKLAPNTKRATSVCTMRSCPSHKTAHSTYAFESNHPAKAAHT